MTSRKRTYSSRAEVEVKVLDTITSVQPIVSTVNTNDCSFVLNLIQQGTGSQNRVGRKASMLRIRVRGLLYFLSETDGAFGSLATNVVRMAVVWDKQPSGAGIPAFDEIFGLTEQDGTESSTFLAPLRVDNMSRFTLVMDKTYDFKDLMWNGSGGSNPEQQYLLSYDEEVALEDCDTTFSGEATPMTITSISSGALYLIFRARYNTAGSSTTLVDNRCFARLLFVDY